MNHLWDFPTSSSFGKVLPKNLVYDRAEAGARIKALFVKEVEQIVWSHKLAPDTINVPAHADVQEIQVMTITQKTSTLHEDVLRTMDRAIPSPILFLLRFEAQQRYAATYKRPNEADRSKWVIGDYFWTDWLETDAPRKPIPVQLDLQALYHALLEPMIPVVVQAGEALEARMARASRLRVLERDAARLESKMHQEKQFNRKVEIHGQLRSLQQEIEFITGTPLDNDKNRG
jgi:Domain of unknown function (DUF4391)